MQRIFFLSVLSCIALMGVFSKRGLLDWRRMVNQNEQLARDITKANGEWADLEHKTEKLKSDPTEQERVVRKVLGYVRENEFVIEF